jgi:hypothetical protein
MVMSGSQNAFAMFGNFECFQAKAFCSKRAQFFILSAVIIASIIVSMASIKNYVNSGDSQTEFYYDSEHLEQEAGSVVDYVFFNNGDSRNITNFFDKSLVYLMDENSDVGVFFCFADMTTLNCYNRGIENLTMQMIPNGGYEMVQSGLQYPLSRGISEIKLKINEKEFVIPILQGNLENQFYFVFRLDATSGEFVDQSGNLRIK